MTRQKVFGIGLHKTGTTTLRECLRLLEYKVCPENLAYTTRVHTVSKHYVPCLKLADEYDAFDDSPWNYRDVYRVLDYVFPDAKFILTVRDPHTWFTSLLRWVLARDAASDLSMIATLGRAVAEAQREELLAAYQEHNAGVTEHFGDVAEKLLVVNWEAGDQWDKLCGFLGKPVPDLVFPHMLRYDAATDKYINFYTALDAELAK